MFIVGVLLLLLLFRSKDKQSKKNNKIMIINNIHIPEFINKVLVIELRDR